MTYFYPSFPTVVQLEWTSYFASACRS